MALKPCSAHPRSIKGATALGAESGSDRAARGLGAAEAPRTSFRREADWEGTDAGRFGKRSRNYGQAELPVGRGKFPSLLAGPWMP